MAQIKHTITRSNASIGWIISQAPYAEACCTEEEMNSIILPYRNNTNNLTGITDSNVMEVSDTVLTITYDFDTVTNRDTALAFFQGETSRKALMNTKRLDASVTYTTEVTLS